MKARVHLSLRMLDLIDHYVAAGEVGDGNVDRADVQALHADAAPPTSPTATVRAAA